MLSKIIFITLLAISSTIFSQQKPKPKLIVGIVIDQMRYDLLKRFDENFGQGGFNRLAKEGSEFTFAHFNYVPTYTAPGHSSIYTGSTPFYHGIISNNYYNKQTKTIVSSTYDKNETTVGSDNDKGKNSPRELLATTITDQLKLFTNSRSKVFSIALKARAAILPGGHTADAAIWYDSKTGHMISSTYYVKKLPDWLSNFNNLNLVKKYMRQTWNLSLPETKYTASTADNVNYEDDVFNEGKTFFPHSFGNLDSTKIYERFQFTPFANDFTTNLALLTIEKENLGADNIPDFLAISYSATDFIGHQFGPNSFEVEDTYIKLDKNIEKILNYLDNKIGKNNYLVFLTADHGGAEVIGYLDEEKIEATSLHYKDELQLLEEFAEKKFGNKNLIENYSNKQIYFNRTLILKNNLNLVDVENIFKEFVLENFKSVAGVYTRHELINEMPQRVPLNYTLNGFNFERGGDVIFTVKPYVLDHYEGFGTTHGTQYNYDTHVPLIFYGWHIPKQRINTPVYIVDIAPTIADLLNITEPNASIGIPLIK